MHHPDGKNGTCLRLAPILALVLAVTLATVLSAEQSRSITASGRVVDATEGIGLWGCRITVAGTTNAVVADREGNFRLPLTPGAQLVFRLAGYVPRTLAVADPALPLEVRLAREAPKEIARVVVEDSRTPSTSVGKLDNHQIRRAPTSLFADTAKIVQMLPGVVTGNDFSSMMYIRGGDFYEMLSLLDDLILVNPYTWGGANTVFNPNLVDNVDFYSGGFPAIYGQAMSGVLDVALRNGNPTNTTGFFEFSAATFEGLLEGPLSTDSNNRSSFIAGIRRTHYDWIAPLFVENSDGITFPFFYDGQVKFTIVLDEKNILNLNTLASYEGMNWKFMETADGQGAPADDFSKADAEFHYRDLRFLQGARLRSRLTDQLALRATLGLLLQDGDYNFVSQNTPMEISQTTREIQARADLSWEAAEDLKLDGGMMLVLHWMDLDLASSVRLIIAPTNGGTNASFFEQDYRIKSEGKGWHFLSTYASAEYRLLPELAVVGGGRLDYFNANGELTASPRLLLRWSPAPGTKLTAATGVYRQAPVYVANGMALDGQYGNPNLLDERSIHRVIGFEQELDNQWLVRLEAFQKSYTQMVSEDADPAINYRNSGRRTSYGFDIFLQKKIGGWLDGWASYSCILSKDIIDARSDSEAFGKPAYEKPLAEWFHPSQDRRHTFTLVANITPHPEWKGSISYRFGSGMPYTPLESVESYHDAERDRTVYRPVWGAYNSRRLPAYHRLDIRIDMPFFGVEGWSSFLQFINLFDNNNVSAYSYESDYAKRKEQTMLPFMLIGGFRFGF